MASWNPGRMFVSLVYEVARKLLSVPAVLVRRRAAKDAELLVLQHEKRGAAQAAHGPGAV